ncbi:MAG: hypothetical protein AAGF50_10960 [Pseudomonadota bacterium]
MTKGSLSETAALRALLSETPDAQLLAEMLGFVTDRLMALDIDQLCGASAHERSSGLPPLKWSSAMFRKTEETNGQQATETRRDCHEVTAG